MNDICMTLIDNHTDFVHQDALQSAVDRLDQHLAVPAPQGLLRIGSSARGELVGRRIDGVTEALGDVEYIHLAVTSSDIASMRQLVCGAQEKFASVFEDITVSSIRGYQLRRLRHRFWLWEASRRGEIVAGHDFRPLLPRITADSLDSRELNEILLWRMLKLIGNVRSDVLFEHLTKHCDEQCFSNRFHVARQVLDLTTWWLPRKGILIAGFEPRVELFIEDVDVPELVRDLVADAWKMRQTGDDQRTCLEWVEAGSAALLWADTERTKSDVYDSRFGDSDLRSQATRFRFYFQRSPIGAIGAATSIARSRSILYQRLRALVEELTYAGKSVVRAPAAWEARRIEALELAERTIEWVTAEA
jgi:hypothetical protein